ncbi:DUF2203 domain-containing protein [Lignipirellula cremea]|uniref:DUF2203 domain-containing protein n=1 Tax=Lignipirellula cremea TaxID=2528010 RepID=A0A518DPV8_9BACT|nr:DUF2203 domain-containing protein [Lignipirellula cremea]QDU93871.1 hypothetical protein Pla8534_16550 [Lignipirellula cremea]
MMDFQGSYQPTRLFTVDEANATLPLVRAITFDLMQMSRDVIERRERLDSIKAARRGESGEFYDDELAHVEGELERDGEKLAEYVDELRQIGVEPKGLPDGLVDFPSLMDDRVVFLCWKYGEPEVLHWHDIDSGFGGRQPLAAGMISGGDDEQENLKE